MNYIGDLRYLFYKSIVAHVIKGPDNNTRYLMLGKFNTNVISIQKYFGKPYDN